MIDYVSQVRECKEELANLKKLREVDLQAIRRLEYEKNAREEELRDAEAKIRSMKDHHAEKVHDLERRLERERSEAGQERDALHRVHQMEQQKLNTKHRAEYNELLRKHDEEKNTLETSWNTEIDQMINEREFIKAEHRRALAIKEEHATQLTNALLAKDNDTYLPASLGIANFLQFEDDQIKAKLEVLVRSVDDLARLEWKMNQEVWTEQVTNGLDFHGNLRLLKKNILQDSIWTILNQHIFGSPFRIFGDEGQLLDIEWRDKHRQGLLFRPYPVQNLP